MRCASCGGENREGAKFCNDCGAPLALHCPSCQAENRAGARFCNECSTPLGGEGKPPAAKSRKRLGTTRARKATPAVLSPATARLRPTVPEAERRQLTVMFCDLVGSTALSAQLDPEDYRAVVQQYHQTCMEVIQRYEGHLAQYLGDGLLVYFGYPAAHEDDARRAVRTGLETAEAIREQKDRALLQVRIGIHTGLVVIGDVGAGSRTEQLALGQTPNVAARIQGLAEPNTVLISAATQRLVERQFESQPFGSHWLKGIDTPIAVYHVQGERQSVSPLARSTTLTPLVGREQEVGLLMDRWEQAKEGRGQVVLLSGEPGIGKSRLAYTLREHVTREGLLLFEARCSPYHQHSALYPLIEVLQRTMLFTQQDTDEEKVQKLERALVVYGVQDTLPFFTALLSLPIPSPYPPLNLTPQKQKERTLQATVQLVVAQAERQATVSVWEDLHWADPSSLEFLSLLMEQIPTTKLLLVLTFRPEFTSPWKPRSHISHLVLNRLGHKHVEVMIESVKAGKQLSVEVIEQIRAKTDGVPLFVEELTKNVLESVDSLGASELPHHTPHPLAIPATLHEALLARLDRLSNARQVAQLGATVGREFSRELLQAITSLSAPALEAALSKLVDAEILYQRGIGEQARYFFKHALIQDTAYQSLLKSARRQYHQQIVQVLEERFPDTKATQPELLAYHYTEAGLSVQAISYWQRAGQRASERLAYVEATSHLTRALELLKTLPDTPERIQQELAVQLTLGPILIVTKGWGAPDTERTYTRARELCEQLGETPQLITVLYGLCQASTTRAEYRAAHELGEQLFSLAHHQQDRVLLLVAHYTLGMTLYYLGEFARVREHMEQGLALYDPQQHRFLASRYGQDLGVSCVYWTAFALWQLGYPDQALQQSVQARTLTQELTQPFSLALALANAATVHQFRREAQEARDQADALSALCTEQGIPFFLAWGMIWRGWALAVQGQGEEGIAQIRRGLAASQATGAENWRSHFLALLAEACGTAGQREEGLSILAEALAGRNKTGECFYEAELYRLKGTLTLQQFKVQDSKLNDAGAEAEMCFLKAIEIARHQQAKSWELRAATSLARLWQQQGKRAEAHQILSEIYGWFTEGFDTKDLQEAKALLDELERSV